MTVQDRVEDAVAGRDEAERGRDDLVPLTDAEGTDKQVQAARAAVDSNRVLPADVVSDGPLELRHLGPKAGMNSAPRS